MRNSNGNLGIRFKTTPREGGWFNCNGRYVVLTEQTILDLQEIVKAGHSAEAIVELLSNTVYKASQQEE